MATAKAAAEPKPKKPARPTGRPTLYSEELAAHILAEISAGKSIRKICEAPEMPNPTSIYLWLQKYEAFSKHYAQACAERADAIFEETMEIADDGTNDWMERLDKEGVSQGWALNGEHVQRSRLRVDTRKWFVSKLHPKKYGDKLQVGGDEGGTPIRFILDGRDVTPESKKK